MYHHPLTRLRRAKKQQWSRDLFTENHLLAKQLILPIFVTEGVRQRIPILTMPGVELLSVDLSIELATRAYANGIKAIALFPKIEQSLKNAKAQYALKADNIICKAIKAIKNALPDLGVIADVALDPYTDHGHDGVLDANNLVDNDKTINLLSEQAMILVEAGCDVLAPSDMMDGRIIAIRKMLENKGLIDVQIFSYAAKYASNFYGPFRDAVGSNRESVNKSDYQLNPANTGDAIKKVMLDVSEGADAVIVKPGMPYLDIIKEIKSNNKTSEVNVIAYQVSGEYAMLKFAAEHNALNYNTALFESLLALKRAGASAIITYAALDVAIRLKSIT